MAKTWKKCNVPTGQQFKHSNGFAIGKTGQCNIKDPNLNNKIVNYA